MKLRSWPEAASRDVRSVIGGLLVQDHDARTEEIAGAKLATRRAPTPEEERAMAFGWKVVKHVKSNAIVFAGPDRTLGIGAGQMSRVDAVRIAVWKAGEAGLSLAGSAVASDAFSPFPMVSFPPAQRAPRRPCSRVARCATKRWSRPLTSAIWPWF